MLEYVTVCVSKLVYGFVSACSALFLWGLELHMSEYVSICQMCMVGGAIGVIREL